MAAAIPPPTPELAELTSILGEADARALARTFLANTPQLLSDLAAPPSLGAEPSPGQMAAHTLKSTARLVGAHALAAQASALETRLVIPGATPTPSELADIHAEAARVHALIVTFAGL